MEEKLRRRGSWVSGGVNCRFDPTHFQAVLSGQSQFWESVIHYFEQPVGFPEKHGVESVTVAGTGTSLIFQASRIPKLPPPPPLIAQNKSSPIAALSKTLPDASTTRASKALSAARPYFLSMAPYAPPVTGPSLDPNTLILNINLNSPELSQINHDKRRRRFHVRGVGNPFVVMAAAADSELNAGFFSANDGGLDVGFNQWREYEQRLGRGGHQEGEILGSGLENGIERRSICNSGEESGGEWNGGMGMERNAFGELMLKRKTKHQWRKD
nr:hypothetical protein PanWU01x14_309560 [Ipomoea batatas]GME01733.1 hypothetical protein PanWU01x14_309560 [Ipomoea batatas]